MLQNFGLPAYKKLISSTKAKLLPKSAFAGKLTYYSFTEPRTSEQLGLSENLSEF
jgi:hypothetical protein